MNRALRAATTGVLLLSPLALSACSAGQVTQTATQQRDKVGAMAEAGDITLRAVTLQYPQGGVYEAGDDAELSLAIVNGSTEADTLVDISGQGFGEAEIESADASGSSSGLEIPGGARVLVGDDGDATITLTDLDEEMTTGQSLELELTFENAGSITLPVTVGTPDRVLDRGELFDFHHEESAAEDETASEGGH